MKKFTIFIIALLSVYFPSQAREIKGAEANKTIQGAELIRYSGKSSVPEFVKFRAGLEIPLAQFEKWAHSALRLPANYGFSLINSETDAVGMQHYRYRQTINGIPVEGSMYLVHVNQGYVMSVNGRLYDKISATPVAAMQKEAALQAALNHINAQTYRWQIPSWENHLKEVQHDPSASWYPKATLAYAPLNGDYRSDKFRLCYKFDIYAQVPLSRNYVFVDAVTGDVIYKLNRIHDTDVPATAVTAYSGTRNMITDSVNATTYRLRDGSRGLGVETYNLQQSTNYVNTDFTDTDNFWDNVNPQQDEYASDAHWGAEMTYDFYLTRFNRNSLDNNGQKLLSYVHYDVGFTNAFWDGTSMTYGDGGGGYTPLTSLEITGHEISHGITENTCNLVYADESGALNEGFSDCIGNAIRYYGKQPATINWFIGDEIGGTPFRNMADPNQFQNPDCYGGTFWNAPNEVHNNSGVLNFWFYLVSEGGSGTNDLNDVYNVGEIGIDTAAAILYHAWSVYMFPDANYADARYYTIQSAADLYGACTNPVMQVTNAWHAVGVGNAFIFGVVSDFSAPQTSYCQIPAEVDFTNLTNNGGTYIWDFGDGTTSTLTAPTHTYANYGTYDVKLIADGGACGIDSILKVAYIDVDTANPCIVILTNGSNQTQTSCAGQIFDTGGPNANYGDSETSTITIAPLGASTVTLTFTQFAMEAGFDYLYIYDGPSAASPLIGQYSGFGLPNGGTVSSTGSSITVVQTSDVFVTEAGFAFNWQCQLSNVAPTANFIASTTVSCSGVIQFTDLSLNGPTGWLWDFGDGNTSILQNPSYTYTTSGVYTVTLTATNGFGSSMDSIVSYITINIPSAPSSSNVSICPNTSASLVATGVDSLVWFATPTGGVPVYTGGSFTTPILTATTTYYVESDIYPALQYADPHDSTFGGGTIFNNNNYHDLIFNCYSPVKLVSVKVYAQGAGMRTITLIDENGIQINSVTVNIPDGPSRVTLDFDLPVGNNMELGCEGLVDLFRNNSGAMFPYTLAGLVSITGTNAGAPGYYYYFYDWELQEPPCVSARTPVTVDVANVIADYSFTVVGVTYTFTDLSTGSLSWFWDFDDGNTSPLQNPVHTYTANGTYNVVLIVNDGTCSDTTFQTIVVTSVGLADASAHPTITYPNPVRDVLILKLGDQFASQRVEIRLNNTLGQSVSVREISGAISGQEISIPASFAPSVYELVITGESGRFVQKIVKQ